MITRRQFWTGLGGVFVSGFISAGYAFGIEPFRLRVQPYKISPPNWPKGLKLKIAALADIHPCNPWMSPDRIRYIVEQTNSLEPDIIVLLGDYGAGHHFVTNLVRSKDWSKALSGLSAPLGTHAVLGNHDWWEDKTAQKRGYGPTFGQKALENVGISVYENQVIQLQKDRFKFWLAGLGDQIALLPRRKYGRSKWQGVDNLPDVISQLTDDAPAILLAHEPDIFPQVPERFSLTLSGHTHRGQVRLFGYSPVLPSKYKNRYAYGHIVEYSDRTELGSLPRHLIVSGGLGNSIMPVRFGVPPEIVLVELTA